MKYHISVDDEYFLILDVEFFALRFNPFPLNRRSVNISVLYPCCNASVWSTNGQTFCVKCEGVIDYGVALIECSLESEGWAFLPDEKWSRLFRSIPALIESEMEKAYVKSMIALILNESLVYLVNNPVFNIRYPVELSEKNRAEFLNKLVLKFEEHFQRDD